MNIQIVLRLLHRLGQLRRHERWTRPQLEAYQTEALRRLREHAYAHSPFYRQFHEGLTDRPLHELPVLTKTTMMERFDELVTDRMIRLEQVRAYAARGEAGQRYLNRYWVNATSGSSGQPGFFLFNESEWVYILASFCPRPGVVGYASTSPVANGWRPWPQSAWHLSSQVAATVKSWWRPSLRLPASQPLPQIVEQLNDWQPQALIAYASMAGILAEEQLAGRLWIASPVVYTASEC